MTPTTVTNAHTHPNVGIYSSYLAPHPYHLTPSNNTVEKALREDRQ